MSFQWIIDNASTISVDRNPVVGQSITRNQTVRAVSRGSGIWKFTVELPNGLAWSEIRPDISKMEALGKFATGTIQVSNTGQNYIVKYQGNSVNYTGFYATTTAGSASITLTTSPTTSSGYKFRAGDIIQLGTNPTIYTVAADVAYNSNSVTLNRSVETTGTNVNLKVGPNVTWTVICTQMPRWTISEYNLVQWDGPFVFYENRV